LNDITSDTVIYALYKSAVTPYSVTVQGGTISGFGGNTANYQFDALVTVTANSAPTGQKFSHWLKNGKIASYNTLYSFHVSQNTILEAVYVPSSATVDKLPCITIDSNPIVKNGEISFIAQCTVDGVTYKESDIVEYGVLLSKTDNPDLSSAGVIRGRAYSKTDYTGQFMITKINVAAGETWYGRAYLIFKDADGNLITVYSNTVNATL